MSEAVLALGVWLQVLVPTVPLASDGFDTDVLAADVLDADALGVLVDDASGALDAALPSMLEANASGVFNADAPDTLDADAGVGVQAYDSKPSLNSAWKWRSEMLLKTTQVTIGDGVAERKFSYAEGTDGVVCWAAGLST